MLLYDLNRIVPFYTSPDRHYHDLMHVAEGVGEIYRLCALSGRMDLVDKLVAAFWFHDSIQRPGFSDSADVAASADFARRELGKHNRGGRDSIVDLVMVTDHAKSEPPPYWLAGCIMSDADLWILSAPPSRYSEYREQVRREYPDVSDADWVVGRSRVIQQIFDRPMIYLAGPSWDRLARERWARLNLEFELTDLRGQDDHGLVVG